MTRFVVVSLWLLLLVAPTRVVADAELAAVIAALETPFRATTPPAEQIRDFSADFIQLSTVVAIDRVQRGEGQVRFKFAPEAALPMFRWDYRLPTEQQIMSDGTTFWVYVPENRQVIVSAIAEVEAEYGDNPAAFFSGLGDLAHKFDISWDQRRRDEAGHFRLLLTPRQPSRFFQQIAVVVHQQAVAARQQGRPTAVFPLVSTQVTDVQDNLTLITFVDARWNLDPSDHEFVFEVPPGVEQLAPATSLSF